MRIKSYFAGTVEAAMDLARRELGEDAVLLNSRPAPAEARHLGVHEVVFGVEATAVPAATAGPPSAPGATAGVGRDETRAALARIERALGEVLLQPTAAPTGRFEEPPLVRFLAGLGYPRAFARPISERAAELLAQRAPSNQWFGTGEPGIEGRAEGTGVFGLPAGSAAACFGQRGLAAQAVLAAFEECCPVEELVPDRRVVAFFGPPGSGRTALLAKIAARAAAGEHRSVVILSTDTLRIAAADQLRTYAAIMGAAFEVHETPRSLARALREHAGRDLILVDTPGWSPAQLADPSSDASPWQRAWSGGELESERHLVLPAWLGAAEWVPMVRRFAGFAPTHLAVTRWDECTVTGPAIAFAASCGLRLSWLGHGQSVPEDFEVATRARWLDLALGQEAMSTGAPLAGGSGVGEAAHA